MELSPEFHGTFWTTFEQHLWYHGIPWNSMEFCPDPKFHGIPWNFFHTSMEFHGIFNFPPKTSMEFHGTFLKFHGIPPNLINFIFKKIIFLNIVFGIWLMIRCYLAKISQKHYILHWFQYRNSYFEHPSVSENGTRSAKMACCYTPIFLVVMIWMWHSMHQWLPRDKILWHLDIVVLYKTAQHGIGSITSPPVAWIIFILFSRYACSISLWIFGSITSVLFPMGIH